MNNTLNNTLLIILLFGFSLNGFSQNGPAGIGNCVLWLKADLGTKNSGVEITTEGLLDEWEDQSGSGNHTTSSTTSPFKTQNNSTAEKIINFNPVVVFDSPNDGFSGPNVGMDGSTTLSEFYVFKSAPAATPAPVTNYLAVFSLGNVITGPYNSAHRLENDPLGGSYMLFDNAFGDNLASAASSDSYYTQAIKSAVYDGITFLGYANGRQVSTKTTNIGISGAGSYKIGDCEPAASGPQSTFSAGEIIIFNTNINPTQRKQVDSYLGIKYGVTLNNNGGGTEGDYLAANGTTTIWDASLSPSYHNNVIGVVRDDAFPLTQKQSQTLDDTTRVYIGTTLQTTNLANTSSIADASYFMIGDNQGEMNSTVSSNAEIPGTCGLLTRIEREWKVQRTNSTEDFNLDITLNPMASAGSVNIADLTLLVDNDGDFSNGGTTCYFNGDGTGISFTYSNPVISVTGISTTHMNNNATSYFTIGSSNSGTPLPVELLNFNASLSEQKTVELNWITTTELNNDFFTIERSNNGINWEPIKEIDGAGNSSSLLSYSTIDQDPYFGISFYRLKQTDFDGQYEYSQIRSVKLERLANSQIEIYPNPTNNKIILIGNTSELEDIKIFNCLGQDVTTYITITKSNEKESVVIDMAKLTIGMYYVKTKTTANKVYKQ
jgi:hypothetical protein